MAGASSAIHVRGLRELQSTLRNLDRELGKEIPGELKDAAEPVRVTAQQLAAERITNIGEKWAQMRVGATTRSVYVAPKSRRRGGSPRRNLAPLLMGRAMLPALELHQQNTIDRLEQMIDRLAARNGF